LADRVHFMGQVSDDQLRDAYRSADLLVIPSRHEGFCIPVIEAMACGLPVLAARAGALPETVGGAGLTFTADDAVDLARQVRRVLGHRTDKETSRQGVGETSSVAIVSPRYGTDFVGGAETSLRTIATVLHEAGHRVEIFTTCARSNRHNHLPEGTTRTQGIAVHRYRMDAREK